MIHRTYSLGKTPARKDAVKLKLADYVDKTKLPTPPAVFGHGFPAIFAYGMFGNDRYGDCVWAGAAHETEIWNHEAGQLVTFKDSDVLGDYAKVTGFDPGDPSTDQGTDMEVAAKYRRKTGVIDSTGKRHKVAAYLAIKSGDLEEHLIAAYLFGAVGIGLKFPKSAMTQFNEGKPWDVVKSSKIDGGHYVPLIGRNGNLEVVTWGSVQQVTPAFLAKYNDESVCYLSDEMLKGGKSPEGFDLPQLKADLAAIAA